MPLSTVQKKTCWILSNAYQGTINQAMGLAEALAGSFSPEITLDLHLKIIKLRPFWYYTAPYFSWFKRYCLEPLSCDISSPWPDYVIACGRQSVLPALFIKEQWEKEGVSDQKKLIFLQNPLSHYKKFDVIVCPAHDQIAGNNVYPMLGAPHILNDKKLKGAHSNFLSLFQGFQNPKIAVILGGPNKYYDMDMGFVEKLCSDLKALQEKHGASLLVTTSRRTPRDVVDVLKAMLTHNAYLYVPGESVDPNPYLGILAHADVILVSCESISMVSEACFTTKPVYLLKLSQKKPGFFKRLLGRKSGGMAKFHHFQKDLLRIKRVEWFLGDVDFEEEKVSLREGERVIEEITQYLTVYS